MGKRELLLIVAFAIAGVVAYQVAAPPAKPGQGFSFSQLWDRMRRGMRGNNASAEWTSQQTLAVADTVRELRIRDVRGGVRLIGESRSDIALEFRVQSSGPDPAEALTLAKAAKLNADLQEDAVILVVQYPEGVRQVANVVAHVPRRLAARIDGSSRLEAADLAALQVTNASGETHVSGIGGLVSGDFRSGTLDIKDAGEIDLTITNARTLINGVRGTSRLDLRGGRCSITGSHGPAEIDSRQGTTIEVQENAGSVRIGGNGGRVQVTAPESEIRLDMRRTDVSVELRHDVPMSLNTTDARIELSLGTSPGIQLDAMATDGTIKAADWQLTPGVHDKDSRLEHAFGHGPRVSVRTQHGDILISRLAAVEIKKKE